MQIFVFLENVGKIKTLKNAKKRDTNKKGKKTFLHLWNTIQAFIVRI